MNDLFDHRTRIGHRVEIGVFMLIVISLIIMILQTFVTDDSPNARLFDKLDVAIWVLFCIEYLFRVITAPVKRQYVLSFYGLVDLLAVLSGVVSVRSLEGLKALRLIRVMRVLKLMRYNSAIDRFSEAYEDIKDELALYIMISGILSFVASYGIWELESDHHPEYYQNILDCAYWAVVSLTTGAGALVPVTLPGKLLTVVLMVIGLGIVAVPSGLMASALARQDIEKIKHHGSQPTVDLHEHDFKPKKLHESKHTDDGKKRES